MGLRAQESARPRPQGGPGARQAWRPTASARSPTWLPILDWTVEDVWARIAQAGTRAHPAYAAGMPRLSCCFCVLASKSSLVRAAQLNPTLAEEYRRVEVRIGHRFTQALSMGEVIELAATEAVVQVEDWAA